MYTRRIVKHDPMYLSRHPLVILAKIITLDYGHKVRGISTYLNVKIKLQ